MTDYVLTILDTTGIQNYVFGTNNLKQITGASHLVNCATCDWAVAALPERNNVMGLDEKEPFKALRIEKDGLAAEVVYAGGGNIVILFADRAEAENFTRSLTRRLVQDAPGLRVVAAHQEFDWQTQALGGKAGVLQGLLQTLAQKKASPPVSAVMPGLGVTVQCAFTGGPAVGLDSDQRPVSADAMAKLESEPAALKRLKTLIDFGKYPDPPRNFDELGGSKGEKSYLAVVHSDGNGMGKRVEAIRDQYSAAGDGNRAYIEALRAFSLSVQRAALYALQKTVDQLAAEVDEDSQKIRDVVPLYRRQLPFRPIVFGGDDVTFVCDGRLGLSLAQCYVQAYASQQLSDGQPAHCRAGVAIVHAHYPFARAYALAEELCASAKGYIRDGQFSAIDWHYATSGVIHGLKEIRAREYATAEGSLQMRPLRVTAEEADWRTWGNFVRSATEFQSGAWAGKHNKVKALREALRGGETSTANFLKLNSLSALPPLERIPPQHGTAWWERTCGYFDAVEVVDLFVPLGEEK